MTYATKSCGKAHAYCKTCRPEVAAKLSRDFSDEHRAALSRASMGNTASSGRELSAASRRRLSRASMGNTAARGLVKTAEHRSKLSQSRKAHVEACDGACGGAACKRPQSPTRIENTLVDVVLAEFPTVIREARFGRYRVDAYLPPPYHLAFEADGSYWHGLSGRPEHDADRDAYLLAEHGLPVVRLGEAELLKIGAVHG